MEPTDPATIYSVRCSECGWFGMSDDCKYGKCKNCGERVKRDKEDNLEQPIKNVEVGPNDFVIRGSLFNCNHWGGTPANIKFNKYIGKSKAIWYVGNCEEKAQQVFCSNNDKHGFGGSELSFPLVDGTIDKVKGPWHGNADSLFSDTGIDVRNFHYTQGIISEDRGQLGPPTYSTIMKNVLYRDEVPIMGEFYRVTKIAMEMAKKLNKIIYCYSESRGGSSCGPIYPDQIDVHGKRMKEEK